MIANGNGKYVGLGLNGVESVCTPWPQAGSILVLRRILASLLERRKEKTE